MNGPLKIKRLTPFQIIILGFLAVILMGALILMLPISSKSGVITPFNKAVFTATSAVCVTGLVVVDTASHWSIFGQSVILLLIQIGGLGVVTVTASFAMFSGRKISLLQRSTMQEALAAPKVGGVLRLTGFIIKITLFIELLGALLMMPAFCRDLGAKGIWLSFFHSISAFCNAGFDILGKPESQFSSLTGYNSNILINVTVMLLIIVGGIGFLTWDDIKTNKFRFKRYKMQSKVILIVSGLLILIPAAVFFIYDFSDLPVKERILSSLFQSVTARTAGFNTANLSSMSAVGKILMIILMLIGGSPGSTAGGMKTTTVAVLFANVFSVFRRKADTEILRRRIDSSIVKNAAAILIMYISLCLVGAMIISVTEGLPVSACIYETASAVGTVGLTLGITSSLGLAAQIVLMILMFLGRVGGLTLIYAAAWGPKINVSKLPQERITVG